MWSHYFRGTNVVDALGVSNHIHELALFIGDGVVAAEPELV